MGLFDFSKIIWYNKVKKNNIHVQIETSRERSAALASKYTERVTIPLTVREKKNWQHAVEISEYKSIPHMVRDIIDYLCDIIEDETRQVNIIVQLVDSDLED